MSEPFGNYGNVNGIRATAVVLGNPVAANSVEHRTCTVAQLTTADRVIAVNTGFWGSPTALMIGTPRVSGTNELSVPVMNITGAPVANGGPISLSLLIIKATGQV